MIRKGDKVMFTYDGKEQKGIVTKGGQRKIEVRIVGTNTIIGGIIAAFREADFELPKDPPSVMDKWSVINYEEFDLAADGLVYRAKIALNGKKVIIVYNAGQGGETTVNPIYGVGTNKVVQQLHDDTKMWVKQFGWEEYTDPWCLGLWFDWCLDDKPYGVLAEDYLKKQKEEWDGDIFISTMGSNREGCGKNHI